MIKHPLITKNINFYLKSIQYLENYGLAVMIFFIRCWMAQIFWYSGIVKVESWYSTIYLFKDVYHVPMLYPTLAAYLATTIELTCPILLFFGLATRLATLPMLIMVAVINFTYLDLLEHAYWAMLLGIILLYGPGRISLDYLIKKNLKKQNIFELLKENAADIFNSLKKRYKNISSQ